VIDPAELARHRQMAALHGYRMHRDEAYAAEHRAKQRRDRARREELEAKIQQLLAIAPAVGDQVQIAIAGHSHDGAIGTVVAVKIDHACGQVLATVDLKPKPRTTTLPAWAKRIRRGRESALPGRERDPLGVAQLSPLVQRLEGISVLHLRPARLLSNPPAALVTDTIAPQDEDSLSS
jgi:hypothetical protein